MEHTGSPRHLGVSVCCDTAGPLTCTQEEVEDYLVFGGGQSEPYSCTCIPKKHTSTPSISSKAKSALVRYGKDSDISPESTNLK